jgi:hypothetical protein
MPGGCVASPPRGNPLKMRKAACSQANPSQFEKNRYQLLSYVAYTLYWVLPGTDDRQKEHLCALLLSIWSKRFIKRK